jgi:hypothetical protein
MICVLCATWACDKKAIVRDILIYKPYPHDLQLVGFTYITFTGAIYEAHIKTEYRVQGLVKMQSMQVDRLYLIYN